MLEYCPVEEIMAKTAHQQTERVPPQQDEYNMILSSISDMDPAELIHGPRSPAQTLQERLFDRLETEGIITRWPLRMRILFILMCAATSWAAILLPLSLT